MHWLAGHVVRGSRNGARAGNLEEELLQEFSSCPLEYVAGLLAGTRLLRVRRGRHKVPGSAPHVEDDAS